MRSITVSNTTALSTSTVFSAHGASLSTIRVLVQSVKPTAMSARIVPSARNAKTVSLKRMEIAFLIAQIFQNARNAQKMVSAYNAETDSLCRTESAKGARSTVNSVTLKGSALNAEVGMLSPKKVSAHQTVLNKLIIVLTVGMLPSVKRATMDSSAIKETAFRVQAVVLSVVTRILVTNASLA